MFQSLVWLVNNYNFVLKYSKLKLDWIPPKSPFCHSPASLSNKSIAKHLQVGTKYLSHAISDYRHLQNLLSEFAIYRNSRWRLQSDTTRNSYWKKIDWSERRKKFWVLQKDCLFVSVVSMSDYWLYDQDWKYSVHHFLQHRINLPVTKDFPFLSSSREKDCVLQVLGKKAQSYNCAPRLRLSKKTKCKLRDQTQSELAIICYHVSDILTQLRGLLQVHFGFRSLKLSFSKNISTTQTIKSHLYIMHLYQRTFDIEYDSDVSIWGDLPWQVSAGPSAVGVVGAVAPVAVYRLLTLPTLPLPPLPQSARISVISPGLVSQCSLSLHRPPSILPPTTRDETRHRWRLRHSPVSRRTGAWSQDGSAN